MIGVTLHESDRECTISELSSTRAAQVLSALRFVDESNGTPRAEGAAKVGQYLNMKAAKILEQAGIKTWFVPDDRDLSHIHPIPRPQYFSAISQKDLAPLLDALKRGDVELAAALAPENTRLCGYTVLHEAQEMYETGSYAADNWTVQVPPGVYPIFANKFQFNEIEGHYTNKVKDYPGIMMWYSGAVTSNDLHPNTVGSETSVIHHPYAFNLAELVFKGTGKDFTVLLKPFEARQSHFKSPYDGQEVTSHGIFDTSLPELLPGYLDPIDLRHGLPATPSQEKPSISNILTDAARRAAPQHIAEKEPDKAR